MSETMSKSKDDTKEEQASPKSASGTTLGMLNAFRKSMGIGKPKSRPARNISESTASSPPPLEAAETRECDEMSEMMSKSKDDTKEEQVSPKSPSGTTLGMLNAFRKSMGIGKPKSRPALRRSESTASSPPPLEAAETQDQNLGARARKSFRRVQKNLTSPLGLKDGKNPFVTNGHPSTDDQKDPVASSVIPTFEQHLEEQRFCEASQLLIDTEKHLFGNVAEAEDLICPKEEEQKLAADYKELEKLVMETVKQSLSLSHQEVNDDSNAKVSALKSAMKAIVQEEEQDQVWKNRSGKVPTWRPCNWKTNHDSKLSNLVKERMTLPANLEKRSSIQNMGRQLKDDLLLVVKVVKSCYPPDMDICNFYAKLYHQTFSTRLSQIAKSNLDAKDRAFLLQWVNEYPGIFQNPELAKEINAGALGKLLPQDLLTRWEQQYLEEQEAKLKIYIEQVLDSAVEKWKTGQEPAREDGYYVSTVAYDIIQFINGMVKAAETTVGDLNKAQNITRQLSDSMQRFKVFHEDIIKQNKPNSAAFIKANLGCIKDFRDVLVNKKDLFKEDVQRSCLSVMTDMKQSAHKYLLSPVHKNLKPHYQKLGTKDWLNNKEFEKLLDGIKKELQELQGPKQSSYQELIGQLHQEVTEEYVRRLLKGDVKLKDKDRQQKAYTTVKDNAESLYNLFQKMGSQDDWLKEILTKIAEVLKLQDIPAIQMQMVEMGAAHPDLSEAHVSALLKMKMNLSKNDKNNIKETVTDTLKEITGDADVPREFFSKIILK